MNAPSNPENGSGHPDSERPDCFGDPNRVCPRDEDSFMQPQAECLSCNLLKSCLQQALRVQGLIGARSAVAPAVSKVSGFLKRWSDRKSAKAQDRDRDAQR